MMHRRLSLCLFFFEYVIYGIKAFNNKRLIFRGEAKSSKETIIRILAYKDAVLKKLLKKQIKENSKYSYVSNEDFKEILSWSNKKCSTIVWKITKVIEDLDGFKAYMRDADICPWCVSYDSCTTCPYGKRHGYCCSDNRLDTYSFIIKGLNNNIVSIPGIVSGIKKILKGR